MPTVDAIRRRDSVPLLDVGRVFFLKKLMYFSMCDHSVLYQLNYKLLLRLAIVLLGRCEFSPNVTCVKFASAHESSCHMLLGHGGRLRAARYGGASGCFGLLGKHGGRNIDSLND